jgi:DnaJ-class molecular chaperone
MSADTHDEMTPGDEAPPGTESTGEDICSRCNGEGKVDGEECPDCGGDGKVIRAVGGA